MAQQLYFSRDSKLYVEFANKVWEVPVLDGFSFSQSTNTSDITLAEMQGADGISRRGRRLFTDSLAPAEWSFSTYVRPYKSTEHGAVEEVLWAVMAGADSYIVPGTDTGIGTVSVNTDGNSDDAINTFTVSGNGANANRTPGTYTGVATTSSGSGTGATFKVVVAAGGSATVTIQNRGSGHAVSDVLTISGGDVGGTTPADNISVTVSALIPNDNYATEAITAGTYYINDEVTSGVTKPAGVKGFQIKLTATTTTVTASIESAGTGFAPGDKITVEADTILGGTASSQDLIIQIDSITSESGSFYRATNIDENSTFGASVVVPTADESTINFGQSNRSVLATCNLYFVMETSTTKPMVYKLENAQINEASIDFEVDGIATINWSGFAKNIIDLQSKGHVQVVADPASPITETSMFGQASSPKHKEVILSSNEDFKMYLALDTNGGEIAVPSVNATAATAVVAAIDTGVDSTTNFIRNRLTQLVCTSNSSVTAFPSQTYNLTLTGGNITVSNNITYLVPEELGNVNLPIEGVTGGRTATGNFTCYLTLDTAGTNRGSSVDLFNDMTTSGKGLDLVVNDFTVTFQIGGSVSGDPRLYVKLPKVHIDVPVHSVEDVISVETGFGAYTDDFGIANEIQLEYYGV